MINDFRAILQQIKDAAEGTFNTADMATEALARAGYAENLGDDLYVLAHQTVVDMAGKVLKGSNGRNDAPGAWGEDFGRRFVAGLREGGMSDEMIRKHAVHFVETFVAAVEDTLMNP